MERHIQKLKTRVNKSALAEIVRHIHPRPFRFTQAASSADAANKIFRRG